MSEFKKPDRIKRVAIADDIAMILTDANKLYRWDFQKPLQEFNFPEGRDDTPSSGLLGFTNMNPIGLIKQTLTNERKIAIRIDKMFLDSTGKLIVFGSNLHILY